MTEIELVVAEHGAPSDKRGVSVELGVPLFGIEQRGGGSYIILTPRLASLEQLDEQIVRLTEQLGDLRLVAGFYFKKR